MSENHLFDPAEYGVTIKERKVRTRPEAGVVTADPPWFVLQRVKHPSIAHLVNVDAVPLDDEGKPLAAVGVRLARCGVFGMPLRDLAGTQVPACVNCMAELRKREAK